MIIVWQDCRFLQTMAFSILVLLLENIGLENIGDGWKIYKKKNRNKVDGSKIHV